MNAGVKKNTRARKRLLAVWLILSLITLVCLATDYLGDGSGVLKSSAAITASVVLMAVIKVRVIFREFMEVKDAPVLLGRLTDLAVVIIGVSVLGSYFLGMAVR